MNGASLEAVLSFTADANSEAFINHYDELPLWSAPFGAALLERVRMNPGARVLDVGCGTGFPLLELAQRLGPDCRAVGLDPWGVALTRAQTKARRWAVGQAAFVRGRAEDMPLPAGVFDVVVSNLGVNNFADPAAAAAECYRVTAPRGQFVLSSNLRGHMAEFYAVFAACLRDLGLSGALDALEAHVAHRATPDRLRALLEGAGYREIVVTGGSFPMRFSGGRALLRHYFIQLGFLDGWKAVVPPADTARVFAELERRLEQMGELTLTIPWAVVEGVKAA